MVKLYIDDIRIPKDDDIIVVRNYQDAINFMIDNGIPDYISFDHDIASYDDEGNELTGYDIAKWIVERDLELNILPDIFSFNVHSANPVGSKNIKTILDNYIKFKNKG